MKLVDILARELKVWPADAVTAVQDLDGEVKFDHSHEMPRINKSKDVWIRQGDQGDSIHPEELAEDLSYAIVTRAQWQASVDALNEPDTVEWKGEGLPPVGTVCEWKEKTGFSWVKATVLFMSESSVVMRREDGFEWQMLTKRTVFRPIRTPQQIAAEERETELNRMVATVSMLDKGWARKVCAGLYDAGYRKFEIVEG